MSHGPSPSFPIPLPPPHPSTSLSSILLPSLPPPSPLPFLPPSLPLPQFTKAYKQQSELPAGEEYLAPFL